MSHVQRALPRFAVIAGLLAVTVLPGCHVRGHSPRARATDDAATVAAFGFLAAAVIAEAESESAPEPVHYRIVYVDRAPLPSRPPTRRDRVTEDEGRRPFDAVAARAALARVEVGECRAAGAPRGYGHAKVTFNPDGRASKVLVDTPSGLSDAAVQCIGDRLGEARIAAYEGSLVTVGTTWFVQ